MFSALGNHKRLLMATRRLLAVSPASCSCVCGFGFVEMPDSAAAKAAIQGVQGKELAGRTLTVNEAKPRESRREPRQARW